MHDLVVFDVAVVPLNVTFEGHEVMRFNVSLLTDARINLFLNVCLHLGYDDL